MIRILLPLAVALAVAYLVYRHIRSLPAERRRAAWLTVGLVALVLIVIAATATGRMHWLGAAITGVVVFLARALPALVNLVSTLSWFQRRRGAANQGNPEQRSPSGGPMSRAEALAVLGLQAGASREDIITAHRRLMQKLHPDREGNDYLAAKLNQAKDVLLG